MRARARCAGLGTLSWPKGSARFNIIDRWISLRSLRAVLRLRLMRLVFLLGTCACLFVCLSFGCAGGDTSIENTHDVCQKLVLSPAADASEAELASIDAAAGLWNEAAGAHLTRDEDALAPSVPIAFERSSLAFFGVYDDENAKLIINRAISDDRERTITIAHELGHVFGLPHIERSERLSLMNTANLTQPPTSEDVAAVFSLWGDCRLRASGITAAAP